MAQDLIIIANDSLLTRNFAICNETGLFLFTTYYGRSHPLEEEPISLPGTEPLCISNSRREVPYIVTNFLALLALLAESDMLSQVLGHSDQPYQISHFPPPGGGGPSWLTRYPSLIIGM